MNDISLNTFWHSSLLLMVLFLRISQKSSCVKYKPPKRALSMDSRLQWKTFTRKLIRYWSILTLKMKQKRHIFSKLRIMFQSFIRRHNGHWNGSIIMITLHPGWLRLRRLKASFSVEVSVRFSGSRSVLSCLGWLSQMN